MTTATTSSRIRSAWDSLSRIPGGGRIFSLLLGRMVPYTGSIRPRIVELREGYARVRVADRRAIRNHLNSVHAVALVNLGEVATGLALHYSLPDTARAILIRLSVDFLKKGRGDLVAEAKAPVPQGMVREELTLHTTIRDAAGEEVARVTAHWLVGPRHEAAASP